MHEACGKCPITFMCHQGRLKDILLCPRCGIFQVTHVQERYVINEHADPAKNEKDGQMVKTGDTMTFRIDCPVREVEEDAYIEWCQESDRCGAGKYNESDIEWDGSDWDELASLQASILVPDLGPPQKQYTNNSGGAIPLKLCNECYGNEHAERID